ncbi:MAG: hypothetical protein R3D67_06275 [Hyphomicrobiaceae bacterium]
MARQINRLRATKVAKETKPGLYADEGAGSISGSRRGATAASDGSSSTAWSKDGKAVRMVSAAAWRSAWHGLGRGQQARALIADGGDPLLARQAARTVPTFGEAADQLIASMETSWRNDKHRAQWSHDAQRLCGADPREGS